MDRATVLRSSAGSVAAAMSPAGPRAGAASGQVDSALAAWLTEHAASSTAALARISEAESRWNASGARAGADGSSAAEVAAAAAEHRELAIQLTDGASRLQHTQERVTAAAAALAATAEAVDAAEDAAEQRSAEISGTGRMQRLRAAMADLRRQRTAMDVEIGVLSSAVMRHHALAAAAARQAGTAPRAGSARASQAHATWLADQSSDSEDSR
jgi:chromosome segregation ATPase